MEERMIEIKAAIAAAASAVGILLGWKGMLAVIWVAAMALDYVSGTFAACKAGEWSSATAREGLWHKAGMIIAVIAAAFADIALSMALEQMPDIGFAWPGVVFPVAMVWYILTELGSILENAEKLGAPVPRWLVKMLAVSLTAVEMEKEPPDENSLTE